MKKAKTTTTKKAKTTTRPRVKVSDSGRVMFEVERKAGQRRLFVFSVKLGELGQEGAEPGRPRIAGIYRGLAANAEEALALTLAARVKEDGGRRHVEASPPAPAGREAFERLGLVVLDLTCHGTADWVHVRAWGRA